MTAAAPNQAQGGVAAAGALPDRLTLIAMSCLAYVLAVALHEHLGHATACVLLGSHVKELGAFYVNCDDARLSTLSVRLVELAGPVVSLMTGLVSFRILRRVARPGAFYFLWLLGSIGLMSATGYMLFSGIAGIGDLGTTVDGALHGARPEWLWRAGLAVAGAWSYYRVVSYAAQRLGPRLDGAGSVRVRCARLTALTSYLTGAAVYLAIGLFNPYGLLIVLTSALASSLGGTSGLLWMTSRLDAKHQEAGPGLYFARDWRWIAVAAAATLAYGAVLGPTLRP